MSMLKSQAITFQEGLGEVKEEEGPEISKFMLRIHENNKIKWDALIVVLALYNSFLIPLQIAFEPKSLSGPFMLTLDLLVDFIFVLDIAVIFRTTFYNSFGEEVADLTKIGLNYL